MPSRMPPLPERARLAYLFYMERNGASFARACPVCGASPLARCRDQQGGEVYAIHAGRGIDLSHEEPTP